MKFQTKKQWIIYEKAWKQFKLEAIGDIPLPPN